MRRGRRCRLGLRGRCMRMLIWGEGDWDWDRGMGRGVGLGS